MSSEFDYQIGRFTGTSANVVMNGSEADWNQHYLLRSGQIAPEPPNWAMRAGSHMESLILDWYEEKIGHPITRRGEVVYHPSQFLTSALSWTDIVLPLDLITRSEISLAALPQRTISPSATIRRPCCSGSAPEPARSCCWSRREPASRSTSSMEYDADYAAELMKRADIFLHLPAHADAAVTRCRPRRRRPRNGARSTSSPSRPTGQRELLLLPAGIRRHRRGCSAAR